MFLTNNSENGDNRKSDPFEPETCPHVDPVLPTLAFAARVLRITFTKVHHPTFTFYGILPASIFAETLPIFTFIGIHCFFLDRFECCYFLGLFLIHFQDWSVFCPRFGDFCPSFWKMVVSLFLSRLAQFHICGYALSEIFSKSIFM